MPILRNYSIVNYANKDELVSLLRFSGEFCVKGEVYDRKNFEDGSHVVTSRVLEFDEKTIFTETGTIYHLENISEDYLQFVEALENKIPVIRKWTIKKLDNMFYQIQGICSNDDTFINKKILNIDKNIIITDDMMKYFVNWLDASQLVINGYDDIYYEKFCGIVCRPIFNNKI